MCPLGLVVISRAFCWSHRPAIRSSDQYALLGSLFFVFLKYLERIASTTSPPMHTKAYMHGLPMKAVIFRWDGRIQYSIFHSHWIFLQMTMPQSSTLKRFGAVGIVLFAAFAVCAIVISNRSLRQVWIFSQDSRRRTHSQLPRHMMKLTRETLRNRAACFFVAYVHEESILQFY